MWSLQQGASAVAQGRPELANLIVGDLLTDLSVALQTDNQAHPISELLEVLVKGEALRCPIASAVMAEGLDRGMNHGITRIGGTSGGVRQGDQPSGVGCLTLTNTPMPCRSSCTADLQPGRGQTVQPKRPET